MAAGNIRMRVAMGVCDRGAPPLHRVARVPAGIAIVWSGLHFWPFADSKAWQFLCPMNLAPVVWLGMLAAYALLRRRPTSVTHLLPDVSVLAYLAVSVLSIAAARDVSRGASFVAKLMIMYLAAYSLFCAALRDRSSVRLLFGAVLTALAAAVAACLAARLGAGRESFGFHGDPHKYGTHVAILASLGGAYLLVSPGWRRGAGALLVTGAIASFATVGAISAVWAGMIVLAVVHPERRTRTWALAAAACGAVLGFAWDGRMGGALRADIRLMEADGANVRQRYVEWQAEMNLLEDRAMGGAGAGSINDYRSAYYHRLPKLNTLAAFDQNGWLATAAEMGILGLVTFCWMAGHYGGLVWRTARNAARPDSPDVVQRATAAAAAALGAALVAHLFSSVHYNGVLIAFVFVLALVSSVSRWDGDPSHAVS